MRPSEEINARYDRKEVITDKLNRLIEVKPLRPSETTRVFEMMDGEHQRAFGPILIAASVRRVDDYIIPFPKSRDALDRTMDLLDREGLSAAEEAFAKLNQADNADKKGDEAAKN